MLKIKKGEKKKQNMKMKMKNTVYSVQYTIPSIYTIFVWRKEGTQFFAFLFLPHCEVDGYYSIKGTILVRKGQGEDNANSVPK